MSWEVVILVLGIGVLAVWAGRGVGRWADAPAVDIRRHMNALSEANAKIIRLKYTIDTLKNENDQLKRELAGRPTQRQVQVLEAIP